jgi:hypothetical protein
MSEFVEIKTSVSEIIGIANGLRSRGESLADSVESTVIQIRAKEEGRETFPPDDFTSSFLPNYHTPAEDTRGTSMPANEAVTSSAHHMGTELTRIADTVSDAMWSYGATDDNSGADISNTPLP